MLNEISLDFDFMVICTYAAKSITWFSYFDLISFFFPFCIGNIKRLFYYTRNTVSYLLLSKCRKLSIPKINHVFFTMHCSMSYSLSFRKLMVSEYVI